MKQSILRMIITCALCTAFSMSVYAGDYCMKQKGHHKTKAENCKPACSKTPATPGEAGTYCKYDILVL